MTGGRNSRTATFTLSDGTTDATLAVLEAWKDEGLEALVPGLEAIEPEEAKATADEVEAMLADPADWQLAVTVKEETEVLTKERLAQKWGADEDAVTVLLRPIRPSEKLLTDAVDKLYSPDTSYDRLKEALALPVAQAGLVATGAGLFGLLALEDEISLPWAMKVAVGLAGVAVGLSLVGRYRLEKVTIKPARVDLLRDRHSDMLTKPLGRARVGMALLCGAIAFAMLSTFWPSGDSSPSAKISVPETVQSGSAYTVTVEVSWTGLPDTATRIRTTVASAGTTLATGRTAVDGGEAEQELEVDLPSVGRIDVSSTATDSSGADVGTGAHKSFAVP